MKQESDKLSVLLRDTVLLLCRNGFNFEASIKVQGLLGITLDDQQVFLVHIDEVLGKTLQPSSKIMNNERITYIPPNDMQISDFSDEQNHFKQRQGRRRRRKSNKSSIEPFNNNPGSHIIDNNSFNNDSDQESSSKETLTVKSNDSNEDTNSQHNDNVNTSDNMLDNNEQSISGQMYNAPISSKRQHSNPTENINIKTENEIINLNFVELDCNENQQPMEVVAYNNNNNMTSKGWQGMDPISNSQGLFNNNNNRSFYDGHHSSNPIVSSAFFPTRDSNTVIAHHSNRGRRARRSGQKLYTCEHPNCGLSFYRSYTLYRHQRIKHGQRLMPPSNNSQTDLKCPFEWCQQSFNRASQLHKHQLQFHQIDQVVDPCQSISKNNVDDKVNDGGVYRNTKNNFLTDSNLNLKTFDTNQYGSLSNDAVATNFAFNNTNTSNNSVLSSYNNTINKSPDNNIINKTNKIENNNESNNDSNVTGYNFGNYSQNNYNQNKISNNNNNLSVTLPYSDDTLLNNKNNLTYSNNDTNSNQNDNDNKDLILQSINLPKLT